MDANNVKNLFGNGSITGNAIIDTMFIAQILPILITNFNNMFIILKDVILKIFYMFCRIIFNILGMKFNGSILGRITVKQKNELYPILEAIIFNQKVGSDIINRKVLEMIKYINTNGVSEIENQLYKKYLDINENNHYEISVDYLNNDNIFNLNKTYQTNDNKIEKIFNYQNYILRFTKDRESIEIEITSFSYHKDDNINEILRNFLNDRFNFRENFEYVYHIYLPDTLYGRFIDFLEYSDNVNKRLRYDDADEEKEDNVELQTNCLDVIFNARLIENKKIDYTNDIELKSVKNENNNKHCEFYDLYKKYCEPKHEKCGNQYGYYRKNKKLIMIYTDSSNRFVLTIVDKKLITESEIKETVNFILNTSMENFEKKCAERNKSNEKKEILLFSLRNSQFKDKIIPKRTLESVYLPEKMKKEIRDEFENFFGMEKLYNEFEIPYRIGFLFYGPPGTGKTSLVKALAYHYQINIFIINLNDENINDENISNHLVNIGNQPGKKILLFEDIDSAFSAKEMIKNECKEEIAFARINRANSDGKTDDVANIQKKYLTYSGLLNALDGIDSNYRGLIIIMTTNYIEKLGDALIRPGRIDKKFELTYGDEFQIKEMTKSFIQRRLKFIDDNDNTRNSKYLNDRYLIGEIERFAKKVENKNKKIRPCELQQYLVKNIVNIDDIFDNVGDI